MVVQKFGLCCVLVVFLMSHAINAAQLLVSKPDGVGAYNTIMSAVRAAKAGDTVIIVDEGVYEEQVTIDSTKTGLVLCSRNPTSQRKPKIVWQDKVNIGPTSCADAKIEEKITFDQNGALQIMRVRGVTIDGIAVDGDGAFPFGKNGIWSTDEDGGCTKGGCNGSPCPMQHGNAAISLWITGDVTIRNCDISNGFFGINVKDRNEGGINANPNPSDIEKERVVALSGFGKTGNHVFEHNRIHNNSIGMFFESTWDLGSVIRYNLIYENHHASTNLAKTVKDLTGDGGNYAGGALMFKDHLFSPLAIYNNTFWHNYLIFAGLWRPGNQFTIFNNIYAEPYLYWSQEDVFSGGGSTAVDGIFSNRMHNCVYACQQQAASKRTQDVQATDTATNEQVRVPVTVYEPRIMNNLGEVEAINLTVPIPLSYDTVTGILQNVKVPGNRLVQSGTGANARGFPASADIRWLETKFKSTDPASADFLVPDWDNELVDKYIKDKGWEEAGILDDDGSRADLGAIPFGGKKQNLVKIVPIRPVLINPDKTNEAMISFTIDVEKGEFNNPVIKYLKWIDNIPLDTNSFGDNRKPVSSSSIVDVAIPSNKLKVGDNDSITVTIPPQNRNKEYGFFEIVVEGTDELGNKVQSAMGFLSYRKLEYIFEVLVLSADLKDTLTEVTAGQPYVLRIIPLKLGTTSNTVFEQDIDTVVVSLRSGNDFITPQGEKIEIGGIPKKDGKVDKEVVFTIAPEGGFDRVFASGDFVNPSQNIRRAIFGDSDPIKINPGEAENIKFVSPGSKTNTMLDPGILFDVKLQLTDKFGNKVKHAESVNLKSLKPAVGDVTGAGDTLSDTNGIASFKVQVTDGDLNEMFPLVGTLSRNGNTDTTYMIVGKARPRLIIMFSDTLEYNPEVEIPKETCSGTRVKMQVRATRLDNGTYVTLTDINAEVGIELNSDNLSAFADETSDQAISSVTLVNGVASLWVQATRGSVLDGKITAFEKATPAKIHEASRDGINFTSCVTNISSAEYRADNGYGRVDRLDLFYPKRLKPDEIPDSLTLYWPDKGDNQKVVRRESMSLDSLDSSHVIVRLPEPFPDGITFSSQKQLGTSYWRNPTLTNVEAFPFSIVEKVGPLITSAELIERLESGKADTLNIAFSEFVQAQSIKGDAFTLLRGNTVLSVLEAQQVTSTLLKIAIANNGEDASPKAGDSIKIFVNSESISLVVDGDNNSAHPENRPVVITMKEIAPSLTNAYYIDGNGDGTVDSVLMKFNKKVKMGNLSFLVDFRGVSTETLQNSRAVYVVDSLYDSMRVALDLNGAISSSGTGVTDGPMNVVVYDAQFNGVQIRRSVDDSAAPVIQTADYYQGRVLEDKTQLHDTLKVTFSENLKNDDLSSGDPFEFLQTSTGSVYYVSLLKHSLVNNLYMFKVIPLSKDMLTQEVQWSSTGDSVRIHTDGVTGPFADVLGNYQLIKTNRRVKLTVHEIPVGLDIRMGPNPFVPKSGSKVKIIVKPEVLRQQEVNVHTNVTILDNLGNCVFSAVDSVKDDTSLEIEWDGTNKAGRYVGTGTYAVYIKATDKTEHHRVIKPQLRKLAVKRTNP